MSLGILETCLGIEPTTEPNGPPEGGILPLLPTLQQMNPSIQQMNPSIQQMNPSKQQNNPQAPSGDPMLQLKSSLSPIL